MTSKLGWMVRVGVAMSVAAFLATVATVTANTLDPCPECYQCTCTQLCCDGTPTCGSNAQCEQWDTDDDTCQRKGGCSWSCPGGSSATYCCKDYCPEGLAIEAENPKPNS